MAASSRFRALVLTLVALLTLATGAVIAASQSEAGAAAPPKTPGQELLLRLHDLGLGYFFLQLTSEGSEVRTPKIVCARVNPGDQQPRLARFIDRYSPRGCLALHARGYDVPGGRPTPQVIGSGALDAGSAAAAKAGLAVMPELLSHLAGDDLPRQVPPPGRVGDATRLYHWDKLRGGLFGAGEVMGSMLIWRSGSALGAIYVEGGSTARNDREAVSFARLQQQHVADPMPYTPDERYDGEVEFQNPAIEIPIYWLGRSFKPGLGLPTVPLEGAATPVRASEGLPYEKLSTFYGKEIRLDSWTARGFARFLATPDGRQGRAWQCTAATDLDIVGNSVELFAAYDRDYKDCPKGSPTRYFAFVHIGGTVVAVNFSTCDQCSARGDGTYDSQQGLEAVVRGLMPWVSRG